MKKIIVFLLVAGMFFSCKNNTTKEFFGFIVDATMNTATIKSSTDDTAVYTFSTMDADRSESHGLLIGSPIAVAYTGNLEKNPVATKIKTDATYSKAVGQWTMPDPINADSIMGINIMIEGKTASINMATLVYRSWELKGDENKIILYGQSIGNGQTINFVENAIILEKEGKLYLSIEDTDTTYEKAN